jgi:hypothetical protein
MLGQPPVEGALRVELHGMERAFPREANPRGASEEAERQRVAERVCRIGRDHEHARARRRFGDGSRRRARRLADPAFATVEDELDGSAFSRQI